MALSGDCLDKLCGIAVAGGVVAAGVSGASVPTGILELLTTGGHLARAVRGGQEAQCRAYVARVRKAIEKDYGVWLARECGDNWSMKADVQAALFELDQVLPQIRLNAADIVEAGQNGEKLVRLLLGRLPATSLFRRNDTARHIFESLVEGTFALVRSDGAFSAELTSFSFERVHEALDEIGATTRRTESRVDTLARDQAAGFAQTATGLAEIKAMLATEFKRDRGTDPAHLKPLFEAVGHDPNVLLRITKRRSVRPSRRCSPERATPSVPRTTARPWTMRSGSPAPCWRNSICRARSRISGRSAHAWRRSVWPAPAAKPGSRSRKATSCAFLSARGSHRRLSGSRLARSRQYLRARDIG